MADQNFEYECTNRRVTDLHEKMLRMAA